MLYPTSRWAGLATLAFLLAAPAFAADAPDTLTLDPGGGAAPLHWSLDHLKQQFAGQIKTVQYDSHGKHHQCTAVPLLSVLEAAGVPVEIRMDPTADPKTKHRPLRLVILASASDGYAVAFSLAELLPEIGNHPVWIALDQDDAPLAAADRPVKLIAPSDTKPARWIHAVDRLSVIDLSPHPTTAPAP